MLKKIAFVFSGALLLAAFTLALLVMQPVLRQDVGEPAPLVSPEVLEAHVRALTEECHPRIYSRPDNLEKAAGYIERALLSAGGRVERQRYVAEGREYCNIVASFGPVDGPLLVVGAHYDASGEDELRQKIAETPGADDNASGVAVLLALGALLGEKAPAGPVQLVAYCLEEEPFFGTQGMGSYAHAQKLAASGRDVLGMLSLEMLGFFDQAEGSQSYPFEAMGLLYPDRGDFVGVVGRFQDIPLTRKIKAAMGGASDLPVCSMNAPASVPGLDYSDHRNYWPFGVQAVMLTDTAFYRNPNYHTLDDTADSLDYRSMAKTVQGLYAAVRALTAEK